jgi:hypothetical protein
MGVLMMRTERVALCIRKDVVLERRTSTRERIWYDWLRCPCKIEMLALLEFVCYLVLSLPHFIWWTIVLDIARVINQTAWMNQCKFLIQILITSSVKDVMSSFVRSSISKTKYHIYLRTRFLSSCVMATANIALAYSTIWYRGTVGWVSHLDRAC